MTEKRGIFKIVTEPEERPGTGGTGLPGTRWQVFKALVGSRFGALVKINLLTLLFALPAVLVFFLNMSENSLALAALPFSSNAGVGLSPYFDDIVSLGNNAVFGNGIRFAYLLVPALMIAGIGLGGAMHAVGMLFGGEIIPVTKVFFKGIKRNAWQFGLGMAPAGVSAGLVVFFVSYLPVSTLKPFWNVVLMILIILLLVFTLFFTMYLLTQTESYKVRFGQALKNSLAFAIGKPLQNIIFLVLSLIPLSAILFLSGNTLMTFLIFFIVGLFAFSFLALMWTIHTRGVYGAFFEGSGGPAVIVLPDKDAASKDRAPAPAAAVTAGAAAGAAASTTARAQGNGNRNKHKSSSKKKRGKK